MFHLQPSRNYSCHQQFYLFSVGSSSYREVGWAVELENTGGTSEPVGLLIDTLPGSSMEPRNSSDKCEIRLDVKRMYGQISNGMPQLYFH